MKAKAKDKYYNQYFQLYKENLKETWRLIGTLIKRKAKVQSNYSSRIIRNSKVYTNELDVANQFNQHFTTIGPTLASAINPTYDDPTKYIRDSPTNSFYLSAVTEEYVAQLFSNLNERKASLDIPKLASQVSFLIYLKVGGGQLESLRYFDHHTHFIICTVIILSCNHLL